MTSQRCSRLAATLRYFAVAAMLLTSAPAARAEIAFNLNGVEHTAWAEYGLVEASVPVGSDTATSNETPTASVSLGSETAYYCAASASYALSNGNATLTLEGGSEGNGATSSANPATYGPFGK